MILGEIKFVEKTDKKYRPDGPYLWLCLCFCGKEFLTRRHSVLNGSVRSCGCMKRQLLREASTKHGHSSHKKTSKTYISWRGMIDRCKNKHSPAYPLYGGRGIKITDRWNNFENFLEDMKEAPLGKSLDRIDTNGDYCKENCRWATAIEQSNNQRRSVGTIIDGNWISIKELAEQRGIDRRNLYRRTRYAGLIVYKY